MRQQTVIKRLGPFVLSAALVIGACGGGDISLTEYTERVDAIFNEGVQKYESLLASPEGRVLLAEGEELADFTPQDLQVAMERLGRIQAEALEVAHPRRFCAAIRWAEADRKSSDQRHGRSSQPRESEHVGAGPQQRANHLTDYLSICRTKLAVRGVAHVSEERSTPR